MRENETFTFTTNENIKKEIKWLFDSDATNHMSWQEENFEEMKPYDSKMKVGDGRSLPVKGICKIKMNIICLNGSLIDLVVHDVLYVPDISTNLISIGILNKKGFKILFEDDKCIIHLSQETVFECKQSTENNNLFELLINDEKHALNIKSTTNN